MIETEHETVQLVRVAMQSRPDRFRSLERDSLSAMSGHGVPGTMWSGVLAASRVVGKNLIQAVMRG